MHRVSPEVYLIGESALNDREINRYLKEAYGEIGADWYQKNLGTLERPSDSELITELMGRLCYRSFGVGEHNKNITKIREGNRDYIGNIMKSRHGSVTEHGSTNWIIRDVSRVFTHELVRHRTGLSPSQESLRYVRMDDFGLWLPEDSELTPELVRKCELKFESDERFCKELSAALGLDDPGKNFEYKKKWTSFIRRFAPQGMATTIGITINFRSMRHVLELRTAEGAEVEIRYVFDKIARVAVEKWPALLQDFGRNDKGEWVPKYSKI
jgi:thymidylate synthase (FAD)